MVYLRRSNFFGRAVAGKYRAQLLYRELIIQGKTLYQIHFNLIDL